MTEQNATSVRGNAHLNRRLSDPDTAADVAQTQGEIRQMNRAHAMTLAMIRKAGDLTQVEVSQRLGVGQGAVSQLESREDMLLSTLFDYLLAAGAQRACIVVTVNGHDVEVDLASLPNQRARISKTAS